MAEATEREKLGLDTYWDERRKLAVLGRIVESLGYIGTFGHVSVRVPGTELVLITPGAGPRSPRCGRIRSSSTTCTATRSTTRAVS